MTISVKAINSNNINIASNKNVTANFGNKKNESGLSSSPAFGAAFKTYTVGEFGQKIIEWFGRRSTPFNRFVLGATALSLQPFIDGHNKDVDKETRKTSKARSIAKAVAGMTSGILVRFACIKSINALTKTDNAQKLSEWSQALIPTKLKNVKTGKYDIDFTPEQYREAIRLIKKHRETIGSIVALGVMLFTNFAFDVPVTKFLTNKIIANQNTTTSVKSDAKGEQN